MIIEESIRIQLHIFSPVHIGCSDVYEPTNFVIDGNKLTFFNSFDFITALSNEDKVKFSSICTNGNILEIYKFIRLKYNRNINHQEVDISLELVEHYKKIQSMSTFDKKAVINNFIINRTAYNPQNNIPYIPGSSLKGALRTAYLNVLAAINQNIGKEIKHKELEEKLLNGSFSTDPFSMVKVSDLLPVTAIKKKIVYAINKKKLLSDKNPSNVKVTTDNEKPLLSESGPNQIFETIYPNSSFEGVLNIMNSIPERKIKIPIKKEDLLMSLSKHYMRLLENETKELKKINIQSPIILDIKNRFNDKISKDTFNKCFIIRIGHHSGAEAMTINGFRNIKINKGKAGNEYKDQATTIWLASDKRKPLPNSSGQITNIMPFGWAVMELID
jgi:CRISPR-associated protein Csm5